MLRKQALINLTFRVAVPKNRKPKFDLTLRIIDLTNIPLIYGTASVRWHLSSSNAAEHRGRTEQAPIHEHKATWDYHKEIPVRMTIDKTGMLQECDIQFEVLQDFHEGGHGGRVHLGNAKLNLAEYTRLPDRDPQPEDEGDDDGSITRRYLLQDSKVNSTLKIGIKMRQTEGDMNFTAPPLKAAMVVGGIAGVLTTEVGEGDDIPSITSKTRELSEAQDIYRRTLAATWACQAGEMAPDRLIENLFAGGDGGRPSHTPQSSKDMKFNLHHHNRLNSRDDHVHSGSSSDETKPHASSSFTPRPSLLTPQMANTPNTSYIGHRRGQSRDSPNITSTQGHTSNTTMPMSNVSGRASIDQQVQHSQQEHVSRRQRATVQEYTEFDLRDDLKSWSIRVK